MIGVIGLGNMGSGIATTLLRKSFETVVYDIDARRMKPLQEAGAQAAADVADLCARCDTALLSLPSSRVTVDVIEHQVVPAAREGMVVIDLGTTVVRETERLAALLRERGASMIDAPVSGGSAGAAEGTLYVFAGGERSAFETSRKVLEAIGGAKVTYCGESGRGQVVKGVNQLAMGLVEAAFIESIAYGVAGGVEPGVIREAVGGDSGWRADLKRIAERIDKGEGDLMDTKYAEYGYFRDEAERKSFPSPILAALSTFMSQFPATGRDNMNRPYPPLWSALLGGAGRSDPATSTTPRGARTPGDAR